MPPEENSFAKDTDPFIIHDNSLETRATDAAGNSQPMHHPFNREGYLFNMVYPHKITVVTR